MSKSILVVDDEPDLVQLYSMILRMQGYRVHQAVGGQDALNKFEDSQPDLVLLDVMMPDLDGIEVCKRIRDIVGQTHNPVIIMYTANDSVQNRKASVDAGANELVSKTMPVDQITSMISNYLQLEPAMI